MIKNFCKPIFTVLISLLLCSYLILKDDTINTKPSTSLSMVKAENKGILKESVLEITSKPANASDVITSMNKAFFDSLLKKTIEFQANEQDNKQIREPKIIQNSDDNSALETSYIGDVISKIKRLINTIIKVFLALLAVFIAYFVYVYLRKRNSRIKQIEHEISFLKNQLTQNENQINYLKSVLGKGYSIQEQENKKAEDIIRIRSKVTDDFLIDNKLLEEEISFLTKECENRWIMLGHSTPGSNHVKSSPPVPCQDNHHFELMENGWVLSIVCDGAGSAKFSNLGSEYIAKTALPLNLKLLLSKSSWYKSSILPTEEEWRQIINHLFAKSLSDLKEWILNSNYHKESEKEFATTVILSLHNKQGILSANLGDGRGGYLNNQGELKSLFEPYRGDESNSTIFLTSPIWDRSNDYIKTKIINEIPLSVFILSDGLEKISFNCSQLVDGVWVDPNIPFRDFFYPIFKIIKEIPKDFESRLSNDWKNLLENGNDMIKNENDDKTMVLSFLK